MPAYSLCLRRVMKRVRRFGAMALVAALASGIGVAEAPVTPVMPARLSHEPVAPSAADPRSPVPPPSAMHGIPPLAMAAGDYVMLAHQTAAALLGKDSAKAWRGFLGMDPALGEAYRISGMLAYEEENYEVAAPLLIAAYDYLPDHVELMGRLGFALKETGDYERALDRLFLATIHDETNYYVWWWLSDTQRLLGQYAEAVESMVIARNLAPADQVEELQHYVDYTQTLGDKTRDWTNFFIHMDFAGRHERLRRFRRYLAECLTALDLAPENALEDAEGALRIGGVYNQIGIYYKYLQEPDVATHYFQAAAVCFAAAGRAPDIMRNEQNLGLAYGLVAEMHPAHRVLFGERAVAHWEKTLKIARESGDIEYTRYAMGGLLCALLAVKDVGDAGVASLRGDIAPELPRRGPIDDFATAEAAVAEAQCRAHEEDYAGARILLEMALPYYENSQYLADGERSARISLVLAQVYCHQGHLDKALERAANAATFTHGARRFLDTDAFNRGAYGRILRQAAAIAARAALKLDNAERALEEAEQYHIQARLDLLGSTVRDEARFTDLPTETELIRRRLPLLEADYTRAREQDDDAVETLRLEMRLVADRSRLEWLERGIRFAAPSTLSYLQAPALPLGELQAALPEDVTVLYFTFDPWGGAVIALTREALQGAPLTEAREDDVLREMTALRAQLAARDETARATLARLYQLLIAPARPLIATDRVCIVPNPVLTGLPFEALHDDGRFFVQDHAVFYAASASHLVRVLRRAAPERERLRLLAADARPAPWFHAVMGGFAASERLENEDATETAATRGVAATDVLHIAATAAFTQRDPMLGALMLRKDTANDGRLHAAEALAAAIPAAIITLDLDGLSADQGAVLDAFAEALYHAGAHAVLINSWTPDPENGHAFLEAFYKNLKDMDAARACAAARRGLIESAADSLDWTAFRLYGDPR